MQRGTDTWKKGLYCPECNGVFDRSKKTLSSCWVCTRQYHTTCVGLEKENEKFICGSCQRKVQERTLGSRSNQGGVKNMDTPSRQDKFNSSYSKTPVTSSFSRSGRRVTQINFANQF
ncbi:uncharacterized protein LOC111698686 [Eurytemora carolleeae]|uniref:uncharacterized protein LOC111698686 n=1 Tax=Eurytemora carolleeae TaxID=1294199 RepID=UPI000C75D5AE|nr:uncharacterized protein LOC111698686 [Eurytemora carolleeae]|eukprot:XP_023324854.1 uncharacterized protein LOC111698686 [Eurytemora affinis]